MVFVKVVRKWLVVRIYSIEIAGGGSSGAPNNRALGGDGTQVARGHASQTATLALEVESQLSQATNDCQPCTSEVRGTLSMVCTSALAATALGHTKVATI